MHIFYWNCLRWLCCLWVICDRKAVERENSEPAECLSLFIWLLISVKKVTFRMFYSWTHKEKIIGKIFQLLGEKGRIKNWNLNWKEIFLKVKISRVKRKLWSCNTVITKTLLKRWGFWNNPSSNSVIVIT